MKEIIAMHGWGGDSSRWHHWIKVFQQDGWYWQSAERGYGQIPSYMPNWKHIHKKNCSNKNVVICHSLGSHLIDHTVLEKATHVVLLSSFSRFIPEGKDNRYVTKALEGMQKAIGTSKEKEMFTNFFKKATQPSSIDLVPDTPFKHELSKDGRKKLKNDLALLVNTGGLAPGFPINADVLVINGKYDQILSPMTKEILIKDLIKYLKKPPTQWDLINEGHALLDLELIVQIKEWLK